MNHENVYMHVKYAWILLFKLYFDKITLLKSVHLHGNGEWTYGN